MKKILFLVLIPFLISAQTMRLTEYNRGADKEFYFYLASVDSGVYNSSAIELNQFDDDFANYPLGYYLVLDTLTNDASNTEIVGVYIQGNFENGDWVNVDTVLAADTLNGDHSLAAATFKAKGILDLNGSLYMFPKYRVRVEGTHSLGNEYLFKLSLYAYKRD